MADRARLRDGGPLWLVAGVVAGVALQNKTTPVLLLGAVAAGVLVVGPRAPLRSPWPWLGGQVALAVWAPNLVWQAAHGFPQLALSRAIAAGSSGTSEPWYTFPPYQLLLIGPLLVPVWAVGWWRLARDPALRTWRGFAAAYVLLAVVFMATGGKPYYLAGLYPVLLAAGGEPVVRWARARRVRTALLGVALLISLAVSVSIVLPVVPVDRLARTPVPDLYYDAGETVGWPEFAATISGQVELAARIDNGVGLDNDEQDTPVWIARDRRARWDVLWPQLVRVG